MKVFEILKFVERIGKHFVNIFFITIVFFLSAWAGFISGTFVDIYFFRIKLLF